MLHLVLSLILGFLVAGGIALAIMPVLWRRAGAAMRKHIEASMPMSREELQAEIDARNAAHAMAMRRLEMKAETLKKKSGEDFIEISRLREQAKQLQENSADQDETVQRLVEERESLASTLAEREAELEQVSLRLAGTERKLEDEHAELEKLSESYEEASLTSSSRQVELLTRESEVEHLKDTITRLRAERKETERAMQVAKVEAAEIEKTLQAERKQAAELKRELDRAKAGLRSRDEKLERRQKEVARLKDKARESDKKAKDGKTELTDTKKKKEELELQVADLQLQLSSVLSGGAANSAPTPEKRKSRQSSSGNGSTDAVLREQITALAAEVVSMTAALEGPDSPIEENLAQASKGNGEQVPSLADRVQALRQKSASAE